MERNELVYAACCRLFLELSIHQHLDCHYAMPYANYIMSWPFHIPINTIIIGQNPYPQKIHCEFGAAFSYDQEKRSSPPRTVKVLAQDIFNYDGTDINTSICCFRDSWMLIEHGIVMINETVFHSLLNENSNTRATKEMESQVRALQILISESFSAGQKTITCIGMGMPAACMTSILRQWSPKDLMRIKVMTCKNPAARDIGDIGSHAITLGKPAVSKALSQIVDLFSKMSQTKQTQAEKRRQQNIDAFKTRNDEIVLTGNIYSRELQTLEERIKTANESADGNVSLGDIIESSASLRRAIDSHTNALSGHTINLIMLIESIPKGFVNSDKDKKSELSRQPSASLAVPGPSKPRRRITRTPTPTAMDSVQETVEEALTDPVTQTPSQTPSRSRRRIASRSASKPAPSETGTEYTADMSTTTSNDKDISVTEKIHVQSFANWCGHNIPQDPVFGEILNTAAEDRMINNQLTRLVVEYVKQRKSDDMEYDAYDELTDPNSKTSIWAQDNITAQK